MAEKAQVTLDLKIEAANSANTVKDIKQNLKGLKDELAKVPAGSEAFKKLTKAINDTEGKLGDLNDQFSTLTGSGVERASRGFGLLREGMANLDFEKVKIGLNGLRTALAATGIMLLVQGVTYLIQNFDELKNSTGIVGKVMQGLGAIIDGITNYVYQFTDAIGLTNSELDKMGEAFTDAFTKSKDALETQNSEYDRQMRILKANGKDTIELERKKQEGIIATNKLLVEQMIAYVKAGGKMTDEQKKQVTEAINAIKDARVTEYENQKAHDNKLIEQNKKTQEQILKDRIEAAQRLMAEQEQWALQDAELAKYTSEQKVQTTQQESDLQGIIFAQRIQKQKEAEAQAYADKVYYTNLSVEWTRQSMAIAADLTSFFYAHQLNQAKGNAARELEIKKKAFRAEQAFKVANIVIDTTLGMIKAISQNPPPSPVGIISAAMVGLAGTLATVKVLATKFNENGASGGALTAPSMGGATPQPINQVGNTSTLLVQADQRQANPTGPMQPVKAYVVETEAKDVMKRVSRIEEKSKIN